MRLDEQKRINIRSDSNGVGDSYQTIYVIAHIICNHPVF
jgi:hypothetical protein